MLRVAVCVATAIAALTGCSIPNATPSTGATSGPTTTSATATPASACHARHVNTADVQAWEPDPACTPGATDGGLAMSALCPVARTSQIRPPVSYTEPLKVQQMAAYGFTDRVSAHEEDHLIPLELGGAPRDPMNLWPEPHASPNEKDSVENAAHDAVCAGRLSLTDAQHKISTDWYRLGRDLGVIH